MARQQRACAHAARGCLGTHRGTENKPQGNLRRRGGESRPSAARCAGGVLHRRARELRGLLDRHQLASVAPGTGVQVGVLPLSESRWRVVAPLNLQAGRHCLGEEPGWWRGARAWLGCAHGQVDDRPSACTQGGEARAADRPLEGIGVRVRRRPSPGDGARAAGGSGAHGRGLPGVADALGDARQLRLRCRGHQQLGARETMPSAEGQRHGWRDSACSAELLHGERQSGHDRQR
mmetsp:Transcript_78371/g.219688  ORF Transcript_78371/g.219688 Transcript_78371/m.219688 type:complete len:234 (+) Transcript_78371:804-1505(+)